MALGCSGATVVVRCSDDRWKEVVLVGDGGWVKLKQRLVATLAVEAVEGSDCALSLATMVAGDV